MWNFQAILILFLLVSLRCNFFCQAEQNTENARAVRNERVSTSSWVFIDSDEDTDAREILRLVTQIIEDIKRGRSRTHQRIEFTRPPRPRPRPQPAPIVEDPNPCNRKLPEKPNFNVPGRRISEAKCDEFQWDVKRREEERLKSDECDKYRKQNNMETFFGPAVVGGRKTEPGEFPHMGALGWRTVDGGWKFQCGCSLISTKFLLTAAHCSSASTRGTSIANVKPEIVRLGVTNIDKWPEDITPLDGEILQIIVHPQYASPKKYYDIALVQLKYELTFVDEYVLPACLWTRFDTSSLGNRAFATGWGYLDPAGREKADDLQVAQVNIIDSVQCDALLKPVWNRHFYGLQPHQLCAGELKGGVDTCQGDSGGPLQVKIPSSKGFSYIIGVTSFGRGCARANSPGVYTRVSSFIDWIESIVWRQ